MIIITFYGNVFPTIKRILSFYIVAHVVSAKVLMELLVIPVTLICSQTLSGEPNGVWAPSLQERCYEGIRYIPFLTLYSFSFCVLVRA